MTDQNIIQQDSLEPHLSVVVSGNLVEPTHDAFIEQLTGGKSKKYVRFVIAALSSIPWVGGVIGAVAGYSAEKDQEKINILQKLWLEEHREKIKELTNTFAEIFGRLDSFGDEVQQRIESPEYLLLVKKNFRIWDQADTNDKREMLKKLITNAGAISLCPDDLIRLFISWIDLYHEAHFSIIKEINKNPAITRGSIWEEIHGEIPREDSAEADLYRLLISDLSIGRVIRQARDTDMHGRFLKKSRTGQSRSRSSGIMESAFEDTKPYVLTELGTQFVHYVMKDVVPEIGTGNISP